jgi:aminomethyltransferase
MGFFDVSHMGVVDVEGPDAANYLRYLLANNIDRLVPGKALYTCMLNEAGGVIDDLIVYKVNDQYYRVVINAGTRDKDLTWMRQHIASYQLTLTERTDLAMLAVQGPQVASLLTACDKPLLAEKAQQLKPFQFVTERDWFVARTGYTGEDGFEIMFKAEEAKPLWENLIKQGVKPCGLGARDTLRLEAGLNLYGQDMDEETSPLVSNLAWTVAFTPEDRAFIGRSALEKEKALGVAYQLSGVMLAGGGGVIRHGQTVFLPDGRQGIITSGGYSPTLNQSIGFARLPCTDAKQCEIEIRQKRVPAMIVSLPFVRHGKKIVNI